MEKAIWTRFSKSYDQVLKNWSQYQELKETSLNYLNEAKVVLEQGCGTGIIAIALAHRGKEVFGIDNNPYMLKRALENIPENLSDKLHVKKGDALHLAFKDESFDGVVSNNVIFYVKDPKLLLQESYRVLKTGGRIVIAGPKPEYLQPNRMNDLTRHITSEFRKKGIYKSLKKDLEHFVKCSAQLKNDGIYNTYKPDELMKLLKKAGFSKEILSTGERYLGTFYQIVIEK
ncbi:MAG: class I SAM-dependent methyltransferase [Candidatus Woesearchaeota archaeon]